MSQIAQELGPFLERRVETDPERSGRELTRSTGSSASGLPASNMSAGRRGQMPARGKAHDADPVR
ncbi:MAG: hypothetical protein WB773_11490, partial [Isosphaeraceae bacterium]